MLFAGIKNISEVIKEVIKLDKDKEKNQKDELVLGLGSGTIIGIVLTITIFLLLNIWFLLLPPINESLALLIIAMVWIGNAMLSALYYKPSPQAIYRNLTYFVELIATISLLNYAYNILAYNLPYSSLATAKVIALVVIGSSLGFIIKILIEPKRAEEKETVQ